MSDFTLLAGDIVQSVIQDSQVQTTNRTLVLDQLNRVHQKILRETKWLFLKSLPYRFITEPGVSSYWLGPTGQGPVGVSETNLNLTDIASLNMDAIYDATQQRRLPFNSETRMITSDLLYQDGNYRTGTPVSCSTEYGSNSILSLYPSPDNRNVYVPVPTSPVVNYTSGGHLANRIIYVSATIVDNFGNESMTNGLVTPIGIPATNLMTVQAPQIEIGSAWRIIYSQWNLYAGYTRESMTLQNTTPMPLTQTFTEPTTGITNYLLPNTTQSANSPDGTLWSLGITTGGQLTTTNTGQVAPVPVTILGSPDGHGWQVSVNNIGNYLTYDLGTSIGNPTQFYLLATDGGVWKIYVDALGLLNSLYAGNISSWTTPSKPPPQKNNLTPLYGYVIEFRYQIQRKQITAATDILQVPYQYRDVVIAGLNYYVSLYVAKDDESFRASVWKQEFMEGLAQMRRDLRISGNTIDMVMPDRASQINQTSGWGWDSRP